jgi:pyridoxal phosphate enzyme (YggS family)
MISASQIAANLDTIHQRVAAACQRIDRDPAEITILGASKQQPIERLRWAWEAGLRTFGENRVQEALAKMPELPEEIEWHLIGPLQSNKAKKVVPAFAVVHSIDRVKIARVLDTEAANLGRRLAGFLEINLATEDSKHGFLPGELPGHLETLAGFEHLHIVGLMAIPPFEPNPQDSRVWFQQLRELRDQIRAQHGWSSFPGKLSMGMSHDYDIAVEEGATHIRIGTSLFGPRET